MSSRRASELKQLDCLSLLAENRASLGVSVTRSAGYLAYFYASRPNRFFYSPTSMGVTGKEIAGVSGSLKVFLRGAWMLMTY